MATGNGKTMRQPLPVRTRATTARERLAIETAVADIVGPDEANRLIELGKPSARASTARTKRQPLRNDPGS